MACERVIFLFFHDEKFDLTNVSLWSFLWLHRQSECNPLVFKKHIKKALTFYAFHEFAKWKSKILTTNEKRNERTRMVLIYMALNKKKTRAPTRAWVYTYRNSSIFGERNCDHFFFSTLIRREISLRVSMHKFCIINTRGVMHHF